MGNQSSQKIRWQKYLERKNAITYISIFNDAYGKLLQKATGFRFKKQLYTFKDNMVIFYRPAEELAEAKAFFLKIIQGKNQKLKQWHDKGVEYEKKEQELINDFSNITDNKIINQHEIIIDKLYNIFLYLTVIPFLILDAIEHAPEDKNTKNNNNYKELIELFQRFREKSRNPLHEHVLEKIWNAAGKIASLNHDEMQYVTIHEVSNIFNKKQTITKEEILTRKQCCIFYEDEKTGKIIFNYDKHFAEIIGLTDEIIPDTNELKGITACKGKAQGIARIINKPYEMNKFREGDIIISINTTPDLMPVLKKCKAIVTDEGGLTCHASIVSRELNKPCIVGTKFATKVFKDNDILEVDADKGIVTRISSKKT